MTEKERVGEHLNTLSILYYVYAALLAFGMCGGLLYMAMGGLAAAAMKADRNGAEGAEVVGGLFFIIGAGVFVLALTASACCFFCGRWLKARRNRAFSQVVAGFTCLNFPLGTALGVFTFVVLGKPEAEEIYREAQLGTASPPRP